MVVVVENEAPPAVVAEEPEPEPEELFPLAPAARSAEADALKPGTLVMLGVTAVLLTVVTLGFMK